jgi:hypothetical protein
VEVTGFRSPLTENNYDFTRINNPPSNNDPNISNEYRSWGVELIGRLNLGNFRLAVDAAWVNPKIKDSATATLTGNPPRGIPKLTYPISPTHDAGLLAVGLSASGQSSAPNDDFQPLHRARHDLLQRLHKGAPGRKSGTGLQRR